MKPTHIVIHCSQTKDSGSVSWGAIRKYHIARGFDTIGYHFGIELVGDQYEILSGRMPDVEGAHCRAAGMNGKAVGICYVGDFDLTEPPVEMLDKCEKIVRHLMNIYNIPRENIIGHGEVEPKKTCPGKMFNMNKFRGRFNKSGMDDECFVSHQ